MSAHAPSQVGDTAITLHVVAPATGRHHVLPLVRSTPAAGHDMVEAGRWSTAVHAPTTITREHATSGDRYMHPMRHSHVSIESHDAGHRNRLTLTMNDIVSDLNGRGLVAEYEHKGSALAHNAERLVGRIEDQRLAHSVTSVAH